MLYAEQEESMSGLHGWGDSIWGEIESFFQNPLSVISPAPAPSPSLRPVSQAISQPFSIGATTKPALAASTKDGDDCAEALQASYDLVLADVNAHVPYDVATAKYTAPFKNVRDALTAIKGMKLTARDASSMGAYNKFSCDMYSKHGSILSGIRTEALVYGKSITSSGSSITSIPSSGGHTEAEYFFDMGTQPPSSGSSLSTTTQNLISKITGTGGGFVGPPAPEGFQYITPTPSAPDRQLLPEERPEYAAAIAAGLDPEAALGKVKTDTFAKNAASSGNTAGALTTPGPGKTAMPWLNPQNVMGVVGTLFSGWSQYEQAKLAAQLTAAQNQGRPIQLPPTVNNYVQKKAFPWVPVGIGVAGLLAFGLIAYFVMKD